MQITGDNGPAGPEMNLARPSIKSAFPFLVIFETPYLKFIFSKCGESSFVRGIFVHGDGIYHLKKYDIKIIFALI